MGQAFHGGRIAQAARRWGYSMDRVLDFSANLNPWAPVVEDALWEKWKREIYRYPEVDLTWVKERISEVEGLSADYILPTAGGIDAIYVAMRVTPSGAVSILDPGFADYVRGAEAAGREIRRMVFPSKEWDRAIVTKIPESVQNFWRGSQTVVIGNPNNPCGYAIEANALMESIEEIKSVECWIIDEAFVDFTGEMDRFSLRKKLQDFPQVILVHSLTKHWGVPGLRIGFVATSNRKKLVEMERMQVPWALNGVAQAWMHDIYTVGQARSLHEKMKRLAEVREQFQRQLSAIVDWRIHPSTVNFFLVESIGEAGKMDLLRERLEAEGVLVRGCQGFQGIETSKFWRIAVKLEQENNRLIELLRANL